MIIMTSYYERKEFELQKLKDDENKKLQPQKQKVANYIKHYGNRHSMLIVVCNM